MTPVAVRLRKRTPPRRVNGHDDRGRQDEKERAKLIHNEGVKLSATYLNGTAIATFAVGGPTVPFNGMLQGQPSAAVGTIALICALASFAPHFIGRILLKNLR